MAQQLRHPHALFHTNAHTRAHRSSLQGLNQIQMRELMLGDPASTVEIAVGAFARIRLLLFDRPFHVIFLSALQQFVASATTKSFCL
jgi:hypothetical protein